MKYADMRSIAESNEFILVYPQGSCFDGLSHWNPCPGGDNKSTADDLGFIQAMINDISTQYNVDQRELCHRIFKRRNDGIWACPS